MLATHLWINSAASAPIGLGFFFLPSFWLSVFIILIDGTELGTDDGTDDGTMVGGEDGTGESVGVFVGTLVGWWVGSGVG